MDIFSDLPQPSSSPVKNTSGSKAKFPVSVPATDRGDNSGLFGDLPPADDADDKQKIRNKRKSEDSIQNENQKHVKTETSARYILKGYVADRRGEREEMQDAHVLVDNFLDEFQDLHPSIHHLSLYCVFDGHGGSRASRFASESLRVNLRTYFPKGDVDSVEKEMKKCFIDAFKKTDEDFLKNAAKSKPSWKDGTTAVVVLVVNDTLFIANLGDSKAVLCRYKPDQDKCVPIPLSADHSPSLYEERMRIQKTGGHVREGRVMGVLEVSRSLGDGPYKNHGVTCLPNVKRCPITENDRFILIACDGLWKSYSLQESIDFVNKTSSQISQVASSDGKTTEDTCFETACNRLANDAVLRLSGDNVTVMIVSIKQMDHGKS
ncbi:integrin-linked kinase-associated serine/threonine phosphatase 2C-like [Gigantopelta aegis]|uniref:integrin-linked kinase-associated serine/threonine phosphatase 2C-like n=1 Tax=Gigantopelta aegis TaxID=1735272 RepID=UPI001B88A1DC|nr:integrin-linked kinase-associated serine/threonine phosphatase 2C-like [Gigantopelta aegis]